MPTPSELASALEQLPPRQAQLLLRAAVSPLDRVAADYGVPRAALAVNLLRAVTTLAAQLHGGTDELDAARDSADAQALAAALEQGTPGAPADLLRSLGAQHAAVLTRLDELRRARQLAQAPLERWLRRGFVALVVVAAVLYVRHELPGWRAWLAARGLH